MTGQAERDEISLGIVGRVRVFVMAMDCLCPASHAERQIRHDLRSFGATLSFVRRGSRGCANFGYWRIVTGHRSISMLRLCNTCGMFALFLVQNHFPRDPFQNLLHSSLNSLPAEKLAGRFSPDRYFCNLLTPLMGKEWFRLHDVVPRFSWCLLPPCAPLRPSSSHRQIPVSRRALRRARATLPASLEVARGVSPNLRIFRLMSHHPQPL